MACLEDFLVDAGNMHGDCERHWGWGWMGEWVGWGDSNAHARRLASVVVARRTAQRQARA